MTILTSWWRRNRRSIIVAGVLGLMTAAFAWVGWPSHRVVHRWDQPTDVNYGSFDPYTVYVLEGRKTWEGFRPFYDDHKYIVFVARSEPDPPAYGHWLEHDFQFDRGSDEIEHYLASHCSATWSPEGVTITEPAGDKLFIPKSAFIGGR